MWSPRVGPPLARDTGTSVIPTISGNAHACLGVCIAQKITNMAMEQGSADGRLPTTHAARIENRDAKMWRRETERQARTGNRTSRCPCTLCLFGRPLLRTTQARHLRDYGRHPLRRLQEEVRFLQPRGSLLFQPTQPNCHGVRGSGGCQEAMAMLVVVQ